MLILIIMTLWHLNLRHLQALASIARLGSISAAANAINLTQPAITQALIKLEGQLGHVLFQRRPDGMTATAAALVLMPRIEAALAHIASPRVTMVQVRALIALADAGSYVGASTALALAQPSLHRAVNDLAVALQRALVARRGRGLMLTEQGQRVVRSFRLARSELTSGLAELAALNGLETGRIAIGAMPLARARFLPGIITAFHRKHPEVHITIAEGSYAELIEPLRDGALDLLLGALRDPPPWNDVVQHPLFADRTVILARAGHPMAGKKRVSVKALSRWPWILPGLGTPLRQQWMKMFDTASLPLPEVPIECGSVITIRQILLDSDFLTLLSADQVAVELEAGWLTKISSAPTGMVRTIGLITRAWWTPTALQRELVALIETAGKNW